MALRRVRQVSKLQAAERQLNCAIRLYFADDDLLAVHTLSRAAFRILFDIYPERSCDGFDRDLDRLVAELGWPKFNRVTNFLKHADNDPEGILDNASEAETQMGIGFALILHCRIAGRYTPETMAFDMWIKVLNPDKFKLPPDSDPEFEKKHRESNEILKGDGGRAARLMLANGLLQFFRQNPEHCARVPPDVFR
jgi:hypothetical protein